MSREIVLRRKRDVNPPANDPVWFADPDEFFIDISAVADGDYVFKLAPKDGSTPDPVVFTRQAGETDNQVAAAWATKIAAAAAQPTDTSPAGGTLSTWLRGATSAGPRVSILPVEDGPKFRASAAGPGTVTLTPDDEFPITALFGARPSNSAATKVKIVSHLVDGGGNLIDGKAAAWDMEVIEVVTADWGGNGVRVKASRNSDVVLNLNGGSGSEATYGNETRLTVRFTSITGIPVGSTLVAVAEVSP